MILEGYVTNKNHLPIANAMIEIKGEDFVTLFSTKSNDAGYYKLDLPASNYPFLTAVKDYAVNYLEYWCQNISLRQNMTLNVTFDKLEIYGLHIFTVKGAGNSLMAYFRPMSLVKFKQGEEDIVPEDISIKIMIDGQERRILTTNPVKELADNRELTAYLIQVELSETIIPWHRFDIQIIDKDGHYGTATIFNTTD